MRRRKQAQQPPLHEENVTPIDEHEQEEIVQALYEQATQQQEHLNRIFGVACVLMAIASLGVISLLPFENEGWKHVFAHAVYSAILHIVASLNSTKAIAETQDYVTSIFPVIIPLVPLYLKRDTFQHGMEPHVALAVGNAFTTAGSIMLRRDQYSTYEALQQLRDSRYNFKSI